MPRNKSIFLSRMHWLWLIVFVSGCATIATSQFEQQYGKAEPKERLVESLPTGSIDYWNQVKPIVDQRCVVCHGCYDAPCQLKMSSIEGIDRGATRDKVYDSSRIKNAPMTRLFEDAHSVAAWREKGFHPVLNEYLSSPEANRQASVMHRILQLKQDNPLPAVDVLPASFTLSLDRKEVCTKAEEFDDYASKHPLWGMPYALPGLDDREQAILTRWIEEGAVHTARKPLAPEFSAQIARWEKFLNGTSLKHRLSSRYIFEHLSYAHLYFPDVKELRFFKLVRSSTPPGQAIKINATRRPFNATATSPVYYRLQEIVSSIVDKTHMPYALDNKRMQRWQSLFIDADYTVSRLPSYEESEASNPFITFADIPVASRYKFMLDEAQFTIMAYIKGPVCRGEIALDVINDNFWVFFVNPDLHVGLQLEDFLAKNASQLALPANTDNIYRPVHRWREYAKQQTDYLAKKAQYLAELAGQHNKITLDTIWDGDGVNQNAALTVYRHFDNATVMKGLLGQAPKTAWLIDYTLLERIHYLLVAGYDVYGNVGHQLDTRLYMDFLRMEGEANFLLLLPEAARLKERDYWYRNTKEEIKAYLVNPSYEDHLEPDIDYRTGNPKLELYTLLEKRLAKVLPTKHDMASVKNTQLRTQLDRLNQITGKRATIMPENAMLQVNTRDGSEYFTLIRNTAYANMTSLFNEKKNRLPGEDSMTVLPGFIGAYPNAFFVVDEQDNKDFVDRLSNLKTESDYAAVVDQYGIRRTNKKFWAHSDNFLAGYRKLDPVSFGILDYNRLENR